MLIAPQPFVKFMESIVDEAEANKVAKALLAMSEAGQPRFMCQTLKPEKKKGDTPDILWLGTGKGDIPGSWAETKVPDKGEKTDGNYYVWLHEGDQTMSNFMSALLVVAFILITCFPLWPDFLKVGLWYLSCTLLVLILITIIARWILFLFVWIFGYEFWILPNLFDEERSVVDSFKPVSSFEKTGPGQMWWRMAVLVGFGGFCYWAYSQPTEFDDFLKSNRQFVDDLYDGNLLSDASQYVSPCCCCFLSIPTPLLRIPHCSLDPIPRCCHSHVKNISADFMPQNINAGCFSGNS